MAKAQIPICLLGAAMAASLAGCTSSSAGIEQPELGSRSKPEIQVDGFQFRDLDEDGRLSPFEDWRLDAETRAEDLVQRMTVEEKVGSMMHGTLPGKGAELGRADAYDLDATGKIVADKHVTSFITRLTLSPQELSAQNNAVQELAEKTRLGIPLTISTDPRNHFQYVLGAAESGNGTTQWPELLGFAALRDPALVRQFGDIARQEYRAVGIHMALSPQLDLFTEPRWPRGTGTFGSKAELTSELGAAYVTGMQGGADGLQPDGVMTVAKHWVGYGAEPNGWDGHNHYGRFTHLGGNLDYHIQAFTGAIKAGVAGVMPAYPILEDAVVDGKPLEKVAPGYNKQLLTDVLRDKLGFKGIILSDWAITRDCDERCSAPTKDTPQRPQDIAMPWGVENLTVEQRYIKGIEAGLDQFGGTDDVEPLLDAVKSGAVSEARLDQSLEHIMEAKFAMGLFDNPYVDEAAAPGIVGEKQHFELAEKTQREAQVLLQNKGSTLPLPQGAKVWLHGMDPAAAKAAGLTVVDDLGSADFAIIRANTPHELVHPEYFFGSRQSEGRLDFRDGDPAYEAIEAASKQVPTIVSIFLDRPAILTNVTGKASAILANFGASDTAVLDVLLGKAEAKGKLPFELPRSMAAVEKQDPAKPDDTGDPLFPYGAGIVSK